MSEHEIVSSIGKAHHPTRAESKRYEGRRAGQAVTVTVDGSPLNPRFDLCNHSPTGFEWGYGGSGPAQLALALLADHLGNDQQAVEFHQEFKIKIVAALGHSGWTLTSEEIQRALVPTVDVLHDRPTSMNTHAVPVAVFRLGRIVATPTALAAL
ncbi:MAG TPA: DUF6166 domain-containing protein, partial [Verrucomicrobiae bacterium]|nr:DUF6166 domain-containing protein [Verrucomicrobiae bacterium]